MCFSMPKPDKPPPPPNKLDTANDALRNLQARRAAGTTRSSTNVTMGMAGPASVTAPVAQGKTILGG